MYLTTNFASGLCRMLLMLLVLLLRATRPATHQMVLRQRVPKQV
jgi:hypothetical protein